MATQAIAGRRGYIGFAATSSGAVSEVGEATEYQILVEQAQADASSFDSSGWNEHVPVTRQWQLAYSILPTSGNFTTGVAGWSKFLEGAYTKRWMTLYPTTGSTGVRWRGTVLAESGEITGDMGDVMRMDFVYQGHGALLYSTG